MKTQAQHLFAPVADSYAAYRPVYPPELITLLAELAPRTELAWDAGCGSGQLSVPLAERFTRVIATDPSPEQLSRAPAHPRISYRVASAEASGIPSGVVDLAVAAQAAHWFDLAAYYQEVRRVCRRGGLVALVTYGMGRIAPDLDRLIDHLYSDILGAYWPPERRHVEAEYRSLAFPFTELPAPALEIRADWTLDHVLGYIETWSAVRGLERDQGRAALDAFQHQLARAWGPAETARTIRWELAVRMAHVS